MTRMRETEGEGLSCLARARLRRPSGVLGEIISKDAMTAYTAGRATRVSSDDLSMGLHRVELGFHAGCKSGQAMLHRPQEQQTGRFANAQELVSAPTSDHGQPIDHCPL